MAFTVMRSPLLRLLALTAAFALVFLGGCLGNTKLRGLAVELVGIQASAADAGAAQLTVTIRFINENVIPIAAARSVHRLALNGVSLGRITSDRPLGLPQLGSESQALTLRVDAATVAQLRRMQAAGTANYHLESAIFVEAGDDRLESRTSATGAIDLSGLRL